MFGGITSNDYHENSNLLETYIAMENNKSLPVSKIPKIAFSFWEGPQFTYLHFLTIKSIKKFNPDFEIIVYHSISKAENECVPWKSDEHGIEYKNIYCFDKIRELEGIRIIDIDFHKEFNYPDNISYIFKSDIIRLYKLYEHGGIYFDMDILYIKPFPDSILDLHPNNLALFEYAPTNIYMNGFLTSHKNSPILKYFLKKAYHILHRKTEIEYQTYGMILLTPIKKIKKLNNCIKIIDHDTLFPYKWVDLDKLFNTNIDLLKENTFGIHWFNGTPITREFIKQLDFDNVDPTRSIFEREIHKFVNS